MEGETERIAEYCLVLHVVSEYGDQDFTYYTDQPSFILPENTMSFYHDGTFTITNVDTKKYVQFDSNYKSFGCYDEEKGILPYLYVKDETATGITDVTVEKEFDENAPIYNLSGQRVDKNAKGILIQNGKKFIRR